MEIVDQVVHKGGEISYNDPLIPSIKTNSGNCFESVELNAETLADADCVVFTTNHSAFDVGFIQQHAKMIVDMRNMIEEARKKVSKL